MSSSTAGPSDTTPLPLSDVNHYSVFRDHQFYIGRVLISTKSLKVDHAIQRSLDFKHAEDIMPMYSNDIDSRAYDLLDCIVPLDVKDKVDLWVKEQDPVRLSASLIENMLLLDLPNTSFPIVKGQHRYNAYCKVMEENKLPEGAPHPGYLAVKLYHSDPDDPNYHRLYAVATLDNLPLVKKDADECNLCQTILRYSFALITCTLPQFNNPERHFQLAATMRAHIYQTYQLSQTKKAQSSNQTGASDRRLAKGWVPCKIFLDHTLLEALIELNDPSFGPTFSVTAVGLETVFHKVEWLPFLAALFQDIFKIVKDFRTPEGPGNVRGALPGELSKAYSRKNLDKSWPMMVNFEEWLQKAEEFQSCWVPLKELTFIGIGKLKDDLVRAADCFRVLATLLSNAATWNKSVLLDGELKNQNAQRQESCCHTLVNWNSCPEGILRHYIYKKHVGPPIFEDITHYCLIKDDGGVVQAKVHEVISFLWRNHSTLKLPPQCTRTWGVNKQLGLSGTGTVLPPSWTAGSVNAKEFMDSLSEAVFSCPKWRNLLRDILGCAPNSPLPCGIVANLEEPKTPPAPSRRPSSPLTPPPPSPPPPTPSPSRRQTSPFPFTGRQQPPRPQPPLSSSPAASPKKATLYVGQKQHKTPTSVKVAHQRKRRATPVFTDDSSEVDELEKDNVPQKKKGAPANESSSESSSESSESSSESSESSSEEGEKESCPQKIVLDDEQEEQQQQEEEEEQQQQQQEEEEEQQQQEEEEEQQQQQEEEEEQQQLQQEGEQRQQQQEEEQEQGQEQQQEDEEGKEKEVTKKRPALTQEEGSSKRAKPGHPSRAPSTEEQTQESYAGAGDATQEPIYSIDALKKARSPHCIPYMDWSMPEEDIREYLTSFINDKRIPTQTLFNVFQTSIKLYNVGGGSRKMAVWDYDPETHGEDLKIKHVFNDTDMTFDPEEIGGKISATYPTEDVEMRNPNSSSASGEESGEEMDLLRVPHLVCATILFEPSRFFFAPFDALSVSIPPAVVFKRIPRCRVTVMTDYTYEYDFSQYGQWDGDSASYQSEFDNQGSPLDFSRASPVPSTSAVRLDSLRFTAPYTPATFGGNEPPAPVALVRDATPELVYPYAPAEEATPRPSPRPLSPSTAQFYEEVLEIFDLNGNIVPLSPEPRAESAPPLRVPTPRPPVSLRGSPSPPPVLPPTPRRSPSPVPVPSRLATPDSPIDYERVAEQGPIFPPAPHPEQENLPPLGPTAYQAPPCLLSQGEHPHQYISVVTPQGESWRPASTTLRELISRVPLATSLANFPPVFPSVTPFRLLPPHVYTLFPRVVDPAQHPDFPPLYICSKAIYDLPSPDTPLGTIRYDFREGLRCAFAPLANVHRAGYIDSLVTLEIQDFLDGRIVTTYGHLRFAFDGLIYAHQQAYFFEDLRQLDRYYPITSTYDLIDNPRLDCWTEPPTALRTLIDLFDFGEVIPERVYHEFIDDLSEVVKAADEQLLYWHLSNSASATNHPTDQLLVWAKSDYLWFVHVPPRSDHYIRQLEDGLSLHFVDRLRLTYQEIQISFQEIRVVIHPDSAPRLVISDSSELTYSFATSVWETTLTNPDRNLVNPSNWHYPPSTSDDPELVSILNARETFRTPPLLRRITDRLPPSSPETEDESSDSDVSLHNGDTNQPPSPNNGWGPTLTSGPCWCSQEVCTCGYRPNTPPTPPNVVLWSPGVNYLPYREKD
ncbi:hypothetical protein H4582DRAFT_2085411 [Lactarius indigo]|nr:hypothetical protein H4582DRAFT_2085411 [Lactarius indigo]